MKKHSISELNQLYTDGESVDQELFAEQRSNILLYSGEHYNRKGSSYFRRLRDSKDLTSEQKLRLTKNHIQFICDTYVNNIVAPNPGVGFRPKNEKEVHDQKVAEMHHAVWRDAHAKYNIDDLIDDWADSFVQIGEVATKIYFDKNKGPIKAFGQKVNSEGVPIYLDPGGNEVVDDGSSIGMQFEPAQDLEAPIRVGEFVFEEIYGMNLLRPSDCKDMKKAAWLGCRKMVDKKELTAAFPDKEDLIKPSTDDTYIVFDTSQGGGYAKTENQVLVIEYYFKPCHQYPEGYYYITTKEGILAEGPLPGGKYPIVFQAFRKFPTTPRGRSPIKTMRPYQAEINRSASKIAEHQITLGDDKLLIQNGTKVSAGASLPGVRTVSFTGSKPEFLSGRDGSQYLSYMQSQIAELYQVMGVKEMNEPLPSQLDPYTMLFSSARQKKFFQRNIKRFEKYLIEVVKLYLELFKLHAPDDTIIYAVGSNDRINIPELREMPDIGYEIIVEAQAEDIETKLGKQIVINHALQYVGNRLKPEDIGKLMRQMPYANFDESFDDLTLDYDNSVNDILALDRGERPPVNQYDNHVYCIKRLVSRMRQADFQYLDPQIQKNYADKVAIHQEFEAMNQLAIQRAQQGLIPTGGYLVVCDLYVPDPANPNKTQRVRLPSEAVQWLISNLDAQKAGLAPVMDMNQGAQAQLAEQFTQKSQSNQGMNQTAMGSPNEMGAMAMNMRRSA